MRLFLAINLPKEIKNQIVELGEMLKDYARLKCVEEKNLHITLKFLGESDTDTVISALEGVAFKPFVASLRGLGTFPNMDYIKVIWAGCEKGSDEIVTLHDRIESVLNEFKKDNNFHPHATIARVKSVRDKKGLVDSIQQSRDFGELEVKSFELMKSELLIDGPQYEIIKSFNLS
jgi:2'-5' RNA ligase